MDWIQGDKFIRIADYSYSPQIKAMDDYDGLPNTLDINALEDYDIIYTHAIYVKALFRHIELINKKLIIITHNSDLNIDVSYNLPDNVLVWHAQNVNVLNPRIKSIPIGLENDRWFSNVHKKEKMLDKLQNHRLYINLVYMNHNIRTNPSERQVLYDMFERERWVDSQRLVNGADFGSYINNIYNHKFVLCPPGNGIDTHRIWECLYMGTVPIVKWCPNWVFYDDLPILVVNDWEEVTEKFLSGAWDEIQKITWNRDKLNFEYWKNKIRGDKR